MEHRTVSARGLRGLGLALLAVPALEARADERDFPIERFRLASDPGGLLGVENPIGLAPREWSLSLWLGAADDPLVVYSDAGSDRVRTSRLVNTRIGGDLAASVGLHRRAAVSLSVPMILYQDRDQKSDAAVGGMLSPISVAGLGALRVAVKLRVLDQARHGVDLAVIPAMTLPTNTSDEGYLGDTGASFAPELAIGRAFGRYRAAFNFGYRSRSTSTVANLIVDDELFAHLGFGAELGPELQWAATAAFSVAADSPMDRFNQNYAELLTGPTYTWNRDVQLIAAAGAGIAEGFGTPDFRVVLAARVVRRPEPPRPAPPPPPPPPDLDADDDGILDADDRCVREPGPRENQGCPDQDGDADGLVDRLDRCPAEPEDRDAFQDDDGCPDPDDDGDTVLDPMDTCPREPGPPSNQGCPDPDRDGDTVVDRLDTCPDEPGDPKLNGCKAKPLAAITDGKIEIVETVYFKTNQAIIEKRSFKLLESVASVLSTHPSVKVRIEGHTDSVGNDAFNKDLSQRRAAAVRTFLIGKGIDAGRLEPVGFGEDKPVADNRTKEGRAANRRVEFVIVERGGIEVKSESKGPHEDTIDR